MPTRDTVPRPHDGSPTRVEAKDAFPSLEEEEEILTPTRRFALADVTSGLPNDSREEDERQVERRLRDLHGRAKRARAVVASMPGLEGVLASDWRKASRFYERFGVTEGLLRHGAPKSEMDGEGSDMGDGLAPHGRHHESVACLEHSIPSASAFLDLE